MFQLINRYIRKQEVILLLLIILFGGILRFYQLSTIPHGLYFDEISIGYNALSILTRGVDEHGVPYPLWFSAFGEFKMPVYIYLTAAAIKFFGTTDFAVRFSSAFFGTLTTIPFYFLVRELVKKTAMSSLKTLPLVSALLLSISSWHLQFSHAGFEATIGAFFYITGAALILIFWRKRNILSLVSAIICFSLTLYSYDGYRLISMITVIVLFLYIFLKEKSLRVIGIGAITLFVFSIFPVLQFSLTKEGIQRFSQVSAFTNPIISHVPLLQKIFFILTIYLHNYISYFSLNFLFGFGDGISRHQLVGFGPLPYWQLPFLIIAIITLIKNHQKILATVTLILLFIAPLSAALALPSPHTLRSLLMVFPLCILVGIGILITIKNLRRRPIVLMFFFLLICYETALYFHTYYGQYAVISAYDWGAEFKEVVAKTSKLQHTYAHIVVNTDLGFASNEYFRYYTGDMLIPLVVSDTWKKPVEWNNTSYLYIRLHKKLLLSGKYIGSVYLKNNNKDIFAEFWSMK